MPWRRRGEEFTTPYSGLAQVEKDLRVTIQTLGWMPDGRYLPLQDDIASVAFWYQREPHAHFPALPDRDHLAVN